ncbi:MAG TPA: ABC transporter permease, partial [Trueperaceae bacterium]
LTAAYPNLYLDVTLNQDYRQRILDLTQRTFRSTDGLLVLAILIAALGVANTLGMNLSSRRHEIAVLRALGLSRRGVATMVGAEGIVIVVVGAVLGVVAGLLLSHVITAGASALTGYRLSPQYPWRLIGLALLSSPLVGLLASLFPARRAARLSPLHALGSAGTP